MLYSFIDQSAGETIFKIGEHFAKLRAKWLIELSLLAYAGRGMSTGQSDRTLKAGWLIPSVMSERPVSPNNANTAKCGSAEGAENETRQRRVKWQAKEAQLPPRDRAMRRVS